MVEKIRPQKSTRALRSWEYIVDANTEILNREVADFQRAHSGKRHRDSSVPQKPDCPAGCIGRDGDA